MPNCDNLVHRDAGAVPLQHAWHLRRERDGAERTLGFVFRAHLQVAVQPAIRVLFTPGVAVSM